MPDEMGYLSSSVMKQAYINAEQFPCFTMLRLSTELTTIWDLNGDAHLQAAANDLRVAHSPLKVR